MATIKHEGREYVLSPLTVGAFKAIREHLKSLMNPVGKVKKHLDGLPSEERQLLLKAAYEEEKTWVFDVETEEAKEWLAGPDGVAHFVWWSARRQHPDFTLDQAKDYIDSTELDLARATLDQVNNLGNSDGRAPKRKR